jgi:hypothetical protein
LCDGEHAVEEIVASVAELFHTEVNACDEEVRSCIDLLSKEGLVQYRSE